MSLNVNCIYIDILDKTYTDFGVPTIKVFTVFNFSST